MTFLNLQRRVAFAFFLCACAPSFGADAPSPAPANPYAQSAAPRERFELGATLVERHGERGSPLVLIPGLASGAWVWQDLVRDLSPDHVVYVLTLAGFDGRPAAPGNGLDAAGAALRELIVGRKLARPVLVGHSLGGTLSIGFAAKHPELVGGVVSIDGLPVFPGTEAMPAAQRAAMAAGMAAQMAGVTQAGFEAQQQQYMRGRGVLDMPKADLLAQLSAKSDPQAVARYMAELLGTDLRPALPAITAPVLVLSPYFEPDGRQTGHSQAARTGYYAALMAGTPKVQVISVAPARHFAMFDQPALVRDAIRTFLLQQAAKSR